MSRLIINKLVYNIQTADGVKYGAEVKFKDGLNIIYGPNSVGKTSIITGIERLLIILVHEDVDESTNFELLKSFLNENKKSYYIREVVLTFLMYMYQIKVMSSSKKNKCIEIMSEITAKRDGEGHKQMEALVKQQFMDKFKKEDKNKFK